MPNIASGSLLEVQYTLLYTTIPLKGVGMVRIVHMHIRSILRMYMHEHRWCFK